jgi:hypothetical protein
MPQEINVYVQTNAIPAMIGEKLKLILHLDSHLVDQDERVVAQTKH